MFRVQLAPLASAVLQLSVSLYSPLATIDRLVIACPVRARAMARRYGYKLHREGAGCVGRQSGPAIVSLGENSLHAESAQLQSPGAGIRADDYPQRYRHVGFRQPAAAAFRARSASMADLRCWIRRRLSRVPRR
jgi:hypothetical protein